MGSEWREIVFKDVLIGGTRNGIYKKKEFHGSGVKMVNMGELFAYPRLHSVPMKRVELTDKERSKFCLQREDLLFARRSLVAEGAGKCSIVMEVDEPTAFESSIIRARPDPEKTDSLFLYYFFNSPHGVYLLGTIRRQVAVAGITGSDLSQLKVPLPPLPEQRAIAHILGTLDDKIELNRCMNATLEAMARALFKSWFVDFDPVWENIKRHGPGHALADQAAAQPGAPSLPDHILALFPDAFKDSALGLIPQGWRVKSIKECCTKIQNGGTPRRSEPAYWEPATIPWLTSGEVRQNLIIDTENRISEAGLHKSSAKWLPNYSTVVALYGATAGQVAFIASKMTTNQAVCGLVPKANHRYFNYLAMAGSVARLANLARGSAQQNISKGIVQSLMVVVPNTTLLELFDKECEPLFSKWIHNLQESRTLAALRDTLLPRLISGELRVADAERFLAEAGV